MGKTKKIAVALLASFCVFVAPVSSPAFIIGTFWWNEIPTSFVIVYALRALIGIDIAGMMGTWLAREPISGLLFFFNAMLVLKESGQQVTLRFMPVSESQGKKWHLSAREIASYNRNLPRINLAFDEMVSRLSRDPILRRSGVSEKTKTVEAVRIYRQIIRELHIPADVVLTIKKVGSQSFMRAVSAG